jgi:LDH2 family malate/lactate/ureidoglycolate dehydrogenase
MERTMADIRALSPADGFERITLPGELEVERALRWARDGIPLHRDHLRELAEVADKLKIPVPW